MWLQRVQRPCLNRHATPLTRMPGVLPPPAKHQVFILKTSSLFRSVVRVPRTRAAGPVADAQRTRIAQTAVGQPRHAARAVSTEDSFTHVRDLAAIDVDRDLERSATVLAQEFTRVVDDAVGDVQRRSRVDLGELVFAVDTGDT